jgi:ribose-phosphate pyrophosphokinase
MFHFRRFFTQSRLPFVAATATTLATTNYYYSQYEQKKDNESNYTKIIQVFNRPKHYVIVAAEGQEALAQNLQELYPDHFTFVKTSWDRFPDNTDNILVGGYGDKSKPNIIRGSNILFLASFSSNDRIWSQIHVLTMLGESFVNSLTIVLPFFPNGTMERVIEEGRVATANTCAKVLSTLPRGGITQNRLIMYDLHTLQNRFYFDGNTIADCPTAFPLILDRLRELIQQDVNQDWCVAFPDDGAEKRFGHLFKENFPGLELVVCGKKRMPSGNSQVKILDGDARGKRVLIIDDIVNSGGTLYSCAQCLKNQGAVSVSAFCTHAVFPEKCWERFAKGGDRAVFDHFFVTNTNPTISSQLPKDDCFDVLDITPLVFKSVFS